MINEVFNHADDFEPYHSSLVKLQRDDELIKTTPREDDDTHKTSLTNFLRKSTVGRRFSLKQEV